MRRRWVDHETHGGRRGPQESSAPRRRARRRIRGAPRAWQEACSLRARRPGPDAQEKGEGCKGREGDRFRGGAESRRAWRPARQCARAARGPSRFGGWGLHPPLPAKSCKAPTKRRANYDGKELKGRALGRCAARRARAPARAAAPSAARAQGLKEVRVSSPLAGRGRSA
ncbi:MAG: hypothetical protein J3K34DRAFT_35510 [Monoraphidium minutum]|nr:MAG: hypothetical protein J3K34DRAFT_35510 [Monoraphidium minutum]